VGFRPGDQPRVAPRGRPARLAVERIQHYVPVNELGDGDRHSIDN
jgi:hypothetical protein